MGGERNRPQRSYGMLIRAVVVHRPNFLVAATGAHIINLRFRDTIDSSAQPEDDFVREFVRYDTGSLGGCCVGVLLAQHLRRSSVLHIVEPALNHDVVSRRRQISKYQHGCIRRRRTPGIKLYVSGRTGLPQSIKALRNHLKDARVVEVIPQSVIERLEQLCVSRVLAGSLELGYSDPDLLYA